MELLLLKLRLRMIKIDANFGIKAKCRLCNIGKSDQEHLTQCVFLKIKCPEILSMTEKYSDLFGNDVKKLNNLSVVFQRVLREYEICVEK